MICCDVPRFNLEDLECREVPNQIDTIQNLVEMTRYRGKFQFEPFKIKIRVHGRLPRKLKKKLKKQGIELV